jgi:hypothetical protein
MRMEPVLFVAIIDRGGQDHEGPRSCWNTVRRERFWVQCRHAYAQTWVRYLAPNEGVFQVATHV